MTEMSTASCTRPEVSCAGVRFASRIPLENELTSDGDLVESSWRHYLNLARRAADEADQLGEEVIRAGETLDDQIELAERSLSAVCGGTVNVGDVFWALVSEDLGGPCTLPDGAACASPGLVCISGSCVRGIEATLQALEAAGDASAARLRECLGADSLKLVTAGSKSSCAWRLRPGGSICEQEDPPIAHDCPYLPEGDETCAVPVGLPPAAEIVTVTDHLNIFQPDPNYGNLGGDEDAAFRCSRLRELRYQTERDEIGAEVVSSPFFALGNIAGLARRIGWRGYPDDYSVVTLDGIHEWGTGYPARGASTGWPCEDPAVLPAGCAPRTGNEEEQPSLFCSRTSACGVPTESERVQRAIMNDRIARAVLALKIMTGTELGNFYGPYVPYPMTLVAEADSTDYEYDKHRWRLVDAADGYPLSGSTSDSVGEGSMMEYYIEEYDATALDPNDTATYSQEGTAYCMNLAAGSSRHGWTSFILGDYNAHWFVDTPCGDQWNDLSMPSNDYKRGCRGASPLCADGDRLYSQGLLFRSYAFVRNDYSRAQPYWN
ncbi:MAG: hypothetical protein OEY14_17200, partial [Myxococcales bacterium]|nr:hypothetical protein [Myxococcales bacterium]